MIIHRSGRGRILIHLINPENQHKEGDSLQITLNNSTGKGKSGALIL